METKALLRILLIILGFYVLGFQFLNFVFGTMASKAPNDDVSFFFGNIAFVFHVFSIVICIWFIVHQVIIVQRRTCVLSVEKRNKPSKNIIKNSGVETVFRILLVVLGFGALGFQFYHLIFSTMVKISHFGINNCLIGELIPHVLSIVVCIWFIVYKW